MAYRDAPPNSWREKTRPEDLPLKDVKEYLSYSDFQVRYLKEANKRTHCDFDRRIREVENPVMYLLPEVQSMRELARTQSLRFLTAIAEKRVDDAVEIFGQQLSMASHLSQEPFLVSSLVGVACASIGWYDAVYLCEQEGSPNLYWAIAALPKPLADLRESLAYERQFLFEQIKILREVDLTPRSELYWQRFVEQFSESFEAVAMDDTITQFGAFGPSVVIASGFPGAKKFLTEVEGIDEAILDQLPSTHVFFLGVRRYYEYARDEMFKWQYVSHAEQLKASKDIRNTLERDMEEYGWITAPGSLVLPGGSSGNERSSSIAAEPRASSDRRINS